MSNKVFTVAGTSNLNGVVKYRFANSLSREAVLRKCGHSDIKLVELPRAMNKDEAVAFLATQGFSVAPATKSAIAPKKPKVAEAAVKAA